MIKEIIIPAMAGALFGGASVGGGMKFYADHIYVSQIKAEETHDELNNSIVAMNEQIKRSSNRQRIKQLQGWVESTRRTAQRQRRELTTAENNDIRKWETEISNLNQGW